MYGLRRERFLIFLEDLGSRDLDSAPLFAGPKAPSSFTKKQEVSDPWRVAFRTIGQLAKSGKLTSFATNNISFPVALWENNVGDDDVQDGVHQRKHWEDLGLFLGMDALRQRLSIFLEMPQNRDLWQGNG